jgi:hypothetical protein
LKNQLSIVSKGKDGIFTEVGSNHFEAEEDTYSSTRSLLGAFARSYYVSRGLDTLAGQKG